MSCDGNRGKHFGELAGRKDIREALGEKAADILEQIFQFGRSQATPSDRRSMTQASARTQKMFGEMKARGVKPPTHSTTGLPRKDAQFGYAAVQQTLDAIRTGSPLPALARQVLAAESHKRVISAVQRDAGGYMRCGNCGRFASASGGHVCPATTSPEKLNQHLQRRLGGDLPASAYGEGLSQLLEQANQNGGFVTLRHGYTGEEVRATLDGLPLALVTGFVPSSWGGTTAVELESGSVINVLNPSGMAATSPQSGAGSAVHRAAAAYGAGSRKTEGIPVAAATGIQEETSTPAGKAAIEQFTQVIQEAIQSSLVGGTAAPAPAEISELRSAMMDMARAVEKLAERPAASTPAPVAPAPQEGSPKCPRCGLPAESGHTCPPRASRKGRAATPKGQQMAQEHIFDAVLLPSPDVYLQNVPEGVGGNLYRALDEFIPVVDPNFEINEQSERIMRGMSAMMQMGASGKGNTAWTRAFGLYGPPGTGKNTIARQVAASIKTRDGNGNISQGINYVEANITPESSMQDLIGATVLETDPQTGATISSPKLGKIGLAAAMGSVICINEIVRNPKLATALQSMIEDGEIQIDSPEQGMVRIPVHPATTFVLTWNPGYEGDAERPGQAPLSRIVPFRLDNPTAEEQSRRVESFFAGLRGEKDMVDSNARRREEIVARDYSLPESIHPRPEEIRAAVRLFDEIGSLAGGGIGSRQIGLNSDTSTAPGQRQLNRFVALGKTVGWEDALETLKVICDQDDQFETQWSLVRERFEAHFGADGQAFSRATPAQD